MRVSNPRKPDPEGMNYGRIDDAIIEITPETLGDAVNLDFLFKASGGTTWKLVAGHHGSPALGLRMIRQEAPT